jgi:transcriptional regulator with XRE-family HTH domain
MNADRLSKGWSFTDLAVEAGVSVPTVTRFLRGEYQTARMGKKISLALGHPPSRYLHDVVDEALAS